MSKLLRSMICMLLCVSVCYGMYSPHESEASGIEIEPNNTKNQAHWIDSGELFEGFFNQADDEDFYTFATHKTGDIRIVVQTENSNYIAKLTDFQGNSLATRSADDTDIVIQLEDRQSGIYYLSLANNDENTWGEYTLQIYYADEVGPVHNQDFEPNDTLDNAYLIESTKPYDAHFEHVNDMDYYRFQTRLDGDIRVSVESMYTQYTVYLADERGKTITSKSSEGDTTLLAERQPKGIYYVYFTIRDKQYEGSPYTFEVLYPTTRFSHDQTTLEPNDTKEFAYPIKSGQFYNAVLEHRNDFDYYEIELERDGDIYVIVSAGHTRFNVYLLDERGRTVTNTSAQDDAKIHAVRQAKGKYYVYVTPNEEVTNDVYDIQVTYPVNGVVHDSNNLESNNIKEAAYYVQPDQLYHAAFESIHDVEWYSLSLESGPIVFTGTVDNRDYANVVLHDRYGNSLRSASFHDGHDVNFDIKDAGLYFLKLNTTTRAKSYSFKVQYKQGIQIYINGDYFMSNQPAVMEGGTVMVPLRDIFEVLGAEVEWNQEVQSVRAKRGTHEISLNIGSTSAYKNGTSVQLSVPAQIIGTSTMVPLRFVSEALGAEVEWEPETKQVLIDAS